MPLWFHLGFSWQSSFRLWSWSPSYSPSWCPLPHSSFKTIPRLNLNNKFLVLLLLTRVIFFTWTLPMAVLPILTPLYGTACNVSQFLNKVSSVAGVASSIGELSEDAKCDNNVCYSQGVSSLLLLSLWAFGLTPVFPSCAALQCQKYCCATFLFCLRLKPTFPCFSTLPPPLPLLFHRALKLTAIKSLILITSGASHGSSWSWNLDGRKGGWELTQFHPWWQKRLGTPNHQNPMKLKRCGGRQAICQRSQLSETIRRAWDDSDNCTEVKGTEDVLAKGCEGGGMAAKAYEESRREPPQRKPLPLMDLQLWQPEWVSICGIPNDRMNKPGNHIMSKEIGRKSCCEMWTELIWLCDSKEQEQT